MIYKAIEPISFGGFPRRLYNNNKDVFGTILNIELVEMVIFILV